MSPLKQVGIPRPLSALPLIFKYTTHARVHTDALPPRATKADKLLPAAQEWSKIYPPLVEHLRIAVRMNVKTKSVELRSSKNTTETGALQKGEDFVK